MPVPVPAVPVPDTKVPLSVALGNPDTDGSETIGGCGITEVVTVAKVLFWLVVGSTVGKTVTLVMVPF